MTDLADTETISTNLDETTPSGPSGGGVVNPPAEDGKEETSLRDTLADELKKDEGRNKAEKPEKAEKPAKEPAKDDADAAKGTDGDEDGETEGKAQQGDKDNAEPKEKAAAKPDDVEGDKGRAEGKTEDKPGHYQPPKNFLPDAREKWLNVPRPVQRDIDNMAREYETQVQQYQKATERYESLREFDELAQTNGRDLTESLTKLNEIENLMQSNPYAGLNAILQEIGPRKPDGSTVSLYEVAQFVAKQGPEGWQQMVAQRPQQQNQQPQANPEVEQLKKQLADMQVQQTATSVIEPFRAQHPRYDELKGDIAMFLNSGRIPSSLSAPDRLAAAYDMAERLNPPSNVEQPASQANPDADARVDDLSGTKSIKSAPGSASPDLEPDRSGPTRDILREEMRRRRAS